MKTKFRVWRDDKGEWRWRAKRGGRIVAEGGESYKRHGTLLKSLMNFIHSLKPGGFVVIDDSE